MCRRGWCLVNGQYPLKDLALTVFGDDIVEDGQNVGLLAEVFLVGIIGNQAARS